MTGWRKRQIQELKMTKDEIKEEIAELYGFCKALNEATQLLHKQHEKATSEYFAMCNLLKDILKKENI